MPGTRYSRQRELVYQTVLQSSRHPTAEMIYQHLKPDYPTLSRGTVYRNLKILTQEGRLTRMPFPVERYDANTSPHAHFRCEKCDHVFDFPLPYDTQTDLAASHAAPAFQIRSHDLIFYGLCEKCRCGSA